MRVILLFFTHATCVALGFALGIYALPILTQPESPEIPSVSSKNQKELQQGKFDKNREDSDFFHWGEGVITATESQIFFEGELAPGPDYKLYLSPQYVETESDFIQWKSQMVNLGDIKTFDRFVLPLSQPIDTEKYNSVIVWCESFGEFITSAKLVPVSE
ncbi:DM13 domain-containing protein [Vibrio rotiferianus]|uniref:DM13 domain-containing protein n=1 Tax=Vibrio rotiferianus TaxID=190895 RepID=UPI00390A7161